MHPLITTLHFGAVRLPIGSYGVCLALALVLGCGLCLRSAARAGFELGACIVSLACGIAGAFVGAVGLFVLVRVATVPGGTSVHDLLHHLGLVFYGGALGAVVCVVAACRAQQLSAAALLDAGVSGVPALPLAHALGRLGCFLGGCCYGAPFQGAWAVRYTDALAPAAVLPASRHPWPLYEAAALVVLAIAFARAPLAKARPGERFGWYVLAYALLRALLEPLRGDALRGVFGSGWLSTSQLVSGVLVMLVLVWFAGARKPRSRAVLLACVAGLCVHAPRTAHADPSAPLASSARILIEAGWFHMGASDLQLTAAEQLCEQTASQDTQCDPEAWSDERPERDIYLNAFFIDRDEVDNAAYRRCVAAGGCTPAALASDDARIARPQLPVVQVSWAQAARYCSWFGGSLPTEAQWERAASGGSRRLFPWGDTWNTRLASCAAGSRNADMDGYTYAAPTSAFVDGRSVYGALNMAGNVWELVLDRYAASYDTAENHVEPHGPSQGPERVVRGGSWRTAPALLRVTARGHLPEQEHRADVGFRCAYTASFGRAKP